MHQKVPRKKAKGIEIMRAVHPSQKSIPLRKVCENHADIQLVKHAPSLSHSKRNPQELLSHDKEIFVSSVGAAVFSLGKGRGIRLSRVDRSGEKMESPTRLGLGIINIAPIRGRANLTTKVRVWSLGMGVGRC